jgi:parallel beta-helix repeat protein
MSDRRKHRSAPLSLIFTGCLTGAAVMVTAAWGWAGPLDGPQEVIEVFPGPNAIMEALAQAEEGDVLNIHGGRYPEAVVVSTANVALQSAGDGRVVVDGECSTLHTIHVTGDGVSLSGLVVTGATQVSGVTPAVGAVPSEVYFDQVRSGRLRDSFLVDSCNAEYGVNAFNSGTIVVSGSVATGFGDAGFYAGTVYQTPLGPLRFENNESYGNFRGVIVYGVFGGRVRVERNHVHDNVDEGIRVNLSTSVLLTRNLVTDNGRFGIHLLNESHDNAVIRNAVSGHQFDLANLGGTGNCWAGDQLLKPRPRHRRVFRQRPAYRA